MNDVRNRIMGDCIWPCVAMWIAITWTLLSLEQGTMFYLFLATFFAIGAGHQLSGLVAKIITILKEDEDDSEI